MKVQPRELWTGRIVLMIFMIFTLLPLLSMLSSALAPADAPPQGLSWPSDPQFSNFVDAFKASDFPALLWSSLLIAIVVVPGTLLLSSMAGFGLAVIRPRGGVLILGIFVVGLTIPAETTIIPLYYQFQSLNLLNTRWAIMLALLAAFLPFSVFWMRTHFIGMPPEINEAARVDGASTWRLFSRIHLPLAVPALSSLGLLIFLWTLNSFLIPVALTDDPTLRTLAGALGAFQGQHNTNVSLLNAAALLIAAPSLVVFLIFQRQFIKGLVQGAVK